jgi:hypothetical protein
VWTAADRAEGASRILWPMERASPSPEKLLAFWMEWERGETPPGKTMANLKTYGLRDLLEQWVGEAAS